MKNLSTLVFAMIVSFWACAQISTFPYTESFGVSSQCTGWTVTTGTWYHNTTTGTIEVDNHNQTNVHAFLYSPFFNTNYLSHPTISFDLRITADDSTGCVPELDLGYYDSINTTIFNAIQMNIACNRNCTGGLSAYWYVPDASWKHLQFDLVQYPHMQIELNSVFPGTGTFEVKNVYVGEGNAATGIVNTASEDLKLYPNPVCDKLYIDGIDNNSQYSILNLMGEKVITGKVENISPIDVSSLPSGLYTFYIEKEATIKKQKITVSH